MQISEPLDNPFLEKSNVTGDREENENAISSVHYVHPTCPRAAPAYQLDQKHVYPTDYEYQNQNQKPKKIGWQIIGGNDDTT